MSYFILWNIFLITSARDFWKADFEYITFDINTEPQAMYEREIKKDKHCLNSNIALYI